MNKNKLLVAIAGVLIASISSHALATTATSTSAVSLIITAGCTITANPVAFTTIPAGTTATQTKTTTVDISCGNGTNYTWGVDRGVNKANASTTTLHALANAGSYIDYSISVGGVQLGDGGLNLASGATYTETNATKSALTGTGTGATQTTTLTVNTGALSSALPAGTYTDTVTYTIVY